MNADIILMDAQNDKEMHPLEVVGCKKHVQLASKH